MPTRTRNIFIPLGGVDAGGIDPQLLRGQSLKMENLIQERQGAWEGRHGVAALTGTETDDHLGVLDDRAVLFGETIKSHSGSAAASGGLTAPQAADAKCGLSDVTVKSMHREAGRAAGTSYWPDEAELSNQDMAVKDSVVCVVFTRPAPDKAAASERYQLQAVTFNKLTGARLATATLGSETTAQQNARVLDTGRSGKLYICYFDGADISISDVDTTTGAIAFVDTFTNGADSIPIAAVPASGTASMDVAAFDDASNTFLVVYEDSSDDISLVTIETSGTPAVGTSATIAAIGIHLYTCFLMDGTPASEKMVVFWAEDQGTPAAIKYDIVDINLASSGPWTLDASVGANNSVLSVAGVATTTSAASLYYTMRNVSGAVDTDPEIIHCTVDDAGNITSGGSWGPFMDSCQLWGKPFEDSNSNIIVPVYSQAMANEWDGVSVESSLGFPLLYPANTIYMFLRDEGIGNADEHRVVGKCLPENAGQPRHFATVTGGAKGGHAIQNLVTPAATGNTDEWMLAGLRLLAPPLQNMYRPELVKVTFTTVVDQVRPYEQGGLMHIPNGCPYVYDGAAVTEEGFLRGTDGMTATAVAGGSTLTVGTWTLASCYKWTDGKGQIHRSFMTFRDVVITSTQDIDVSVPYLHFTRKTGVEVEAYLSDGAGSTDFRLYLTKLNDKTAQSWDFTITGADPSISNRPSSYVAGGILGHEQPLPYRIATEYQGRTVYAPRDSEQSELRYGKEHVDGQGVALNNATLTMGVPAAGGAVTGLEQLDDKLIIFKADQLYATNGSGLNTRGGGTQFARPVKLSGAVGCINQKSITQIPDGVMFLARQGIYLLTHTLKLVFVGKPVKYHTDTETMRCAVTVPARNYAMWFSSSGNCLVYNYEYRAWAVFTNHEAKDAVVAQDIYYFKRQSADTIWAQDTSAYLDPSSTQVDWAIETPPISFAGVKGFFGVDRFIVVGYKHNDFTMRSRVAYNGAPTWNANDTQSYDASVLPDFDYADYLGAGLAASFADDAFAIEVTPERHEMDSIRVALDNTLSAVAARHATIVGIVFVVSVMAGAARIDDARRLS